MHRTGMRDFEKGKLYRKWKKGRLSVKTIFLVNLVYISLV